MVLEFAAGTYRACSANGSDNGFGSFLVEPAAQFDIVHAFVGQFFGGCVCLLLILYEDCVGVELRTVNDDILRSFNTSHYDYDAVA